MATTPVAFDGTIPLRYDAHLGPLLFEGYATDLAARVRVADGARVLETACGTGIATAALRRALPADAEIVATDLNEAMLEVARSHHGALPNVHFVTADATHLPFDDESFDAVVCQFGVMFFPDKLAGLREALRVLRPGGQLLFNVWDSLERNAIVQVAHETITAHFATDPPTFLTVPFGDHDVGEIRSTLAAAGFVEAGVVVLGSSVERPSARDVAVGMVEGNPTVVEIRERGEATVECVVDAVTDAIAARFGEAPVHARLQALIFSAVRPGG